MISQRAKILLLMCDHNHARTQTTLHTYSTMTHHTRLFHNPYGPSPPTPTIPPRKNQYQTRIHPHTPYLPSTYNQEQKGPTHTSHRIGFLNVNGLKTGHDNRLMEIANYMRQQSINIFGICEVNLNTRDTNQYKKLIREFRQYLKDQTATITTSTTLVP